MSIAADVLNEGVGLLQAGDIHSALRCFQGVAETHPQCWQAWYNQGTAFERLRRRTEAVRCYEKAHAINPSCFVGNEGCLGQLYEAIGDNGKARTG